MKKRIFCISILILFIAVLFVIAIGLMKKEIIVEKNVAKVNKLEADTTTIVPYEENGIKYVTYEQFGAVAGDGKEDFDAMQEAHAFANTAANKVDEVRAAAESGKEYDIFNRNGADAITVKTNVDWNNATFRLHDEIISQDKYDGIGDKNIFIVKNINKSASVTIDGTIGKNTKKITGADFKTKLNEFNALGYKTYLCKVLNDDLKQFARVKKEGAISAGQSQRDYFKIDSEGNVLNNIQWDFENISKFVIYPIPNENTNSNANITIKNGNFITNALKREEMQVEFPEVEGVDVPRHFERNIYINKAANVTISKVTHTLAHNKVSGSYDGFIKIEEAANIKINDCTLSAGKYQTASTMYDSTYDLTIKAAVDLICKNLKQANSIADHTRWGIMATNFSKDVVFDNCKINRIDAHRGIYNLTIKNSTIGWWGLRLIGSGENNTLNVINTTITADHFINLRSDYGSTYKGDANIINCTFNFPEDRTGNPAIVYTDFGRNTGNAPIDFGYECKMPNVNIQNLTVNLNNVKSHLYVMDIENIISNGSLKKSWLGSFLKKYLPNNVNINNTTINNSTSSTPKVIMMTNESVIKNYLPEETERNYIISNSRIISNKTGEIITENTDTDELYKITGNVTFKIDTNPSLSNKVTIKKDGEVYTDGETTWNRLTITKAESIKFTEEGTYEIQVLSKYYEETAFRNVKTYRFRIDKTKPIVTISRNSYKKFDWSASDEEGLKGYQVTTTSSAPEEDSDWIPLSGTSQTGIYTISDTTNAATYYLWIKDLAGNLQKASISTVLVTRTVERGSTLITKLDATNSEDGVKVSRDVAILKGTPIWVSATVNSAFNSLVLYKDGELINTEGAIYVITADTSFKSSATANTADIIIRQNGKAWKNSGINIDLYQGTTKKYEYSQAKQSGARVKFSEVRPGTYKVYASKTDFGLTTLVDTGEEVVVEKTGETTVYYYTVTRSQGENTTLTTKLDSSAGIDLPETSQILKNTNVYVEASAKNGYLLDLIVGGNAFTSGTTKNITEETEITTIAEETGFHFLDETKKITFSTSPQSINITGAVNGTGPYTYTEKSEKNSSGTNTEYMSIEGTVITVAANTPTGKYTYVVTVKDETTGVTAEGTITVTVEKANGTASVTMTGWTYGDSANNPVPVSNTNGTNNVTYQYKLSSADDSTYVESKPSEAGTYTVKATFAETANYKEVEAISNFTIAQKALIVPEQSGILTYNAEEQIASWNNNYNSSYMTVSGNKGTNAGTYTATFRLKNTTNYKWSDNVAGEKTVSWTIGKYDLSNSNIEIIEDENYTGRSIMPEPEVSIPIPSGIATILVKNADFVFGYENNINPTNMAKVKIIAKEGTNYKGVKEVSFTIKPKVVFNVNSGTGIMNEQYVKYDVNTELTQNAFTKEGYTFKGWATSETKANSGIVEYEDKASIKITANMELFAVWKDEIKPEIEITRKDYNTFEWEAEDAGEIAGYAITTNSTVPTNWTTEGTLKRGTKDIDSENTYYVWVKDRAGNTENATIEAYKVEISKGEGITLEVKEGNTIISSVNETKYMLKGTILTIIGTTNEGYGGLSLKINNKAHKSGNTYTVSSNTSIVATALAGAYSVIYDGNAEDVEGSMDNKPVTYGENFIPDPNEYTRTGYTFKLWNEKADGTGEVWEPGEPKQYQKTENMTLYAIWEANEINFENQIKGVTYSTQSQNVTIQGASNGSGLYTYTKVSEKNAKGETTNYITNNDTQITIAANIPAGEYEYILKAKDRKTNKEKSATITINVGKIKASTPTVKEYDNIYDGKSHGITVTNVSGGTVKYSTDNTTWSDTAPTYKDFTNGTKTVYVKVAGDNNHNDSDVITSSIKITKREIVITAENKSKAYGEENPTFTVSIGTTGITGEIGKTAGEPSTDASATSNIGIYDIIQGTVRLVDNGAFKANNYIMEFVSGTLSIIEASGIEIDEYVLEEEMIKAVSEKTTKEVFAKNITAKGNTQVRIVNKNNQELQTNELVKTGDKIQVITQSKTTEYVIVVTGDVNGDGNAGILDIFEINKHRLNKKQLEGAYLEAGDVTGDGNARMEDILKINSYRLGKLETL